LTHTVYYRGYKNNNKEGKPLTWDSTVVCTVADSYVSGSSREAGTAAKTAAQRK